LTWPVAVNTVLALPRSLWKLGTLTKFTVINIFNHSTLDFLQWQVKTAWQVNRPKQQL